ncbi:hypothetical protein DCCM_3333 [Desulfocucumis palustris]|uniref:4Fe-4S ferredoxin-type domain-containing protein n=1 Tax=Desulfocucumis palustris TaxID=1898651 RepID=A0A2L2XJX5_9FIRM|nr:4Fe-4S binding protein [Desulfocucumis palustris]GBF34221.1 hypothetical protein DCCM_3333 [Desulfocucumis palustris]
MQLVVVNKDKCLPDKCENGECIATYSCTWKVLEQKNHYELPSINLQKCLGCARCTFICPLGALEIIQR